MKFAFRQLWKSPGFAATSILTLCLGIAATVAIFSFVDSALIRPLPYQRPSQLVGVFETSLLNGQQSGYSYLNYLDVERFNSSFVSIAAYDVSQAFVLTEPSGAHPVNAIGVTNSFFSVLGITPILGEGFIANSYDEDLQAAPSTVVVSYTAWKKWFEGRRDVLGKTVILNGNPYTVVGVLPPTFQFAPTGATEFWTTLHPYAGDPCHFSRGCRAMRVIARLKNGVSLQRALTEVQSIAAEDAEQYPDPDKDVSANVVSLGNVILGDTQTILLLLFGGASLLLLIAYVNVTSLLLVRSEIRRREFAIRGALGAVRRRLVQQVVAEGFVIVGVSSALGLLIAELARRTMLKLIPAYRLDAMPYLNGTGWNWHVLCFAMALVVIAFTVFTIVPTVRIPFADLRAGLTEGGRGTAGTAWKRIATKLVILELATTMVLLVGAGLLSTSFYKLLHMDAGFSPEHLATVELMAPESKYSNSDQMIALHREIVSRLSSLPGISGVGTANDLPLSGAAFTRIGFIEKPSMGDRNEVGHRTVSSGYLSVLQARLLKGRYFNENDSTDTPLVAIINQSLARRYFSDEDPIGKQFFYHLHGSNATLDGPQHAIQIVGVIADIKEGPLDDPAKPFIYTPLEQSPSSAFCVAVRTFQEAASVLPSLIATIHEIDPALVASGGETMSDIIHDSPAASLHRVSAWLAGAFAGLALVLSAVGLYGVVAYSVSRRTREIGIRMATGATRSSVYQLILKEAARLTIVGLVIGLVGAIAAGIFMRSLLFGVRSWNASILGSVIAMLVITALLASFVPARRAASVNPVEALREE